MTHHADDEIRQFGEEMNRILETVKMAQQDTQKAQWEISQTKKGVDNL
eukprot:CAMPEP_0202712352 /NCGR_PEP_ID=MMETSP1385-20130828/38668_1 /ASSEMBLY_ACC=CAM_ASM_000861 /TAXON_ID=933848 /ORGANISM="Elphidium margaritaceum" /LENGTH=47 /DNA_ID= /DNA_START= /DNA_END= /DNA_ORIENTATION=